jgi:hypothetical protein
VAELIAATASSLNIMDEVADSAFQQVQNSQIKFRDPAIETATIDNGDPRIHRTIDSLTGQEIESTISLTENDILKREEKIQNSIDEIKKVSSSPESLVKGVLDKRMIASLWACAAAGFGFVDLAFRTKFAEYLKQNENDLPKVITPIFVRLYKRDVNIDASDRAIYNCLAKGFGLAGLARIVKNQIDSEELSEFIVNVRLQNGNATKDIPDANEVWLQKFFRDTGKEISRAPADVVRLFPN